MRAWPVNVRREPRNTPVGVSSAAERRRQPRYRLSEEMTFRCKDGSEIAGTSVDISGSGLAAMANGLLRVGETVEIAPVAGGRALALVRHKLGRLYGFEFVDIRTEQVARIGEGYRKSEVWRRRSGKG
jgi:hypothetical protein